MHNRVHLASCLRHFAQIQPDGWTSNTLGTLDETVALNIMNHNEEFAKGIGDHINENFEVYDRFTFDSFFRNLLKEGYDHEEAKGIIIHNCALSTLVLQERIYNGYYLKISVDEIISNDLLELKNEIFNEYFKATRRVLVDTPRLRRKWPGFADTMT